MSVFLQGLAGFLQNVGQTDQAYNQNQHMQKVFAANPDFAQKLYGTIDDQKRLALVQQQQQREQDQKNALAALSAPFGDDSTGKFLGQVAGITGDTGSLAAYAVAAQKQKTEEAKQAQIAAILGGFPLASMATAGNASGSSPMSVRNNNPGNIKDPQTGEFQTFQNPGQGVQAMTQDLSAKISGKSPAMTAKFGQNYAPTLRNLISTWAPPEENNTDAYIQSVSQKTGIAPDQKLTVDDIPKIQPAMVQQEGGAPASNYFGTMPADMASQSSALSKLSQLAAIDPEKYASSYLTAQAAADKETQKQADSIITPENQNLTGQAFLDTIQSPDIKNKTQALLEGRAPYPTINSRTPTAIKQALEAAQQADPTYSATTAPVRMQTAKSFAPTGTNGQVLQSIGTASGHIVDLKEAYDEIHNGGWTKINQITNSLATQSDNPRNAAIKKFQTALNAVAPELAKISAGTTQVAEGEVNKRRDAFDFNSPPGAFEAAVKEAASLIKSRSDTMLDAYKKTMGGNLPPTAPKYSAKTLNHFEQLGVPLVDDSPDVSASGTPADINSTVNWVVKDGKLVKQ